MKYVLIPLIFITFQSSLTSPSPELKQEAKDLEKLLESMFNECAVGWKITFQDAKTIRLLYVETLNPQYKEDLIYLDRLQVDKFEIEKGEYTYNPRIYWTDPGGKSHKWVTATSASNAAKVVAHFTKMHELNTK